MVIGALVFVVVNDQTAAMEELAREETAAVTVQIPSGENGETGTGDIEKRQQRLRQLRQFNQALNHTRMNSERETEADTEKEYSYLELHKITGPHYFKMAPQVLDEMHEQQEVDDDWTNTVLNAAENLLTEKYFKGTSLHSVDCRQSLCKAKFEHETLENQQAFKQQSMAGGPWFGQAADAFGGIEEQPDGTVRSYMYFSKAGDTDTFWNMRKIMAGMIENNPPKIK